MIVGHSFVRRFRAGYRPVRRQDVHSDEDGICFADSIRVREVYRHGVRTFNQFNLITDLPVVFNANYDVLIIDLGSNGIARVNRAHPKATKLLAKYIYEW